MPTTYAIPNGRTVFDATLYTGNGSTQTVVNTDLGTTGFRPDLVWIKIRGNVADHRLTDSVRGVTKEIYSDTTAAEATDTNGLTAFNTNGFNVGSTGAYNLNGGSLVAWQWQAGQGTNVSNTSGTITSSVSANTTAGFSIVTYTGNATSGATIGHGLGVAPSLVIAKERSSARPWPVYHSSIGATNYLNLQSTNASTASSAMWNNTAPSSSVFTVGNDTWTNNSGGTYVAYCWTPIAGYSAFGSYTGNGSTDGPFIYTGFRPKFVMVKRSNAVGNWIIYDATRNSYNVANNMLFPNTSDAEDTGGAIDILSNGFKARSTSASWNGSGDTYIYACFAENPTKFANAR